MNPPCVLTTEGGPTCAAEETPLIQTVVIAGKIVGTSDAAHLKRIEPVLAVVGTVAYGVPVTLGLIGVPLTPGHVFAPPFPLLR